MKLMDGGTENRMGKKIDVRLTETASGAG